MQYKEMTIKNPRIRKRIRSLTGGSFSRVGVAWDKNGNSVSQNQPRFSMFGVNDNGLLVEEAHSNLLTSEQSLLIENGSPVTTGTLNGTYTFQCRTGNIVLSGGATGTVTPTNPITAAVSSATVTLTPDVAATYNQIILKAYPLSWTLGGTEQKAETMTIPSSVLNIDTGGYSNLLPSSQSNTLTSGSPYTTGTLVAGVQYTFSCQTGSYELSGGATGTVTPSTPLTKTPGAATVTLTGDATGNQMSATSVVKPWVLGGTQVNNGAGSIEAEIYVNTAVKDTANTKNIIILYDSGVRNLVRICHAAGTNWAFRTGNNVGSVSDITYADSNTVVGNWYKFGMSWDNTLLKGFVNGASVGTPISNPYLPSTPSGAYNLTLNYTIQPVNTLIRNVVISKTKRADSDITARSVSGYAVDKNVTAILPLKTNLNAYKVGVN